MGTSINESIARAADKRHGRLCESMPEHIAARHILGYLAQMEKRHALNPHTLDFVRSLKVAYSKNLTNNGE